MKNKIPKIIYVVVFIMLLGVPGAVSVFAPSGAVGNEEKAELKGINYMNASQKFDNWFSQSFGLRNELLGLNNSIRYTVFGQSGEQSVIAGKDGWLFYESALHDYDGDKVMSDSDIQKTARILKLASDYVESSGSRFVFASAPNKMEIYGNYMPYYCIEDKSDGNYEKLIAALFDYGVRYADLKADLRRKASESKINIYHKLDSHWNNMGAAEAFNSICRACGRDNFDYTQLDYRIQYDFEGDLYAMLFPGGKEKDAQVVFDCEQDFSYTSRFMGNDDLIIDTENPSGQGSVRMFRDSFGNALHWFFANEFEYGHFTRELPYELTDPDDYDITVIEIVERNIPNILKYPPVMPAQHVEGISDIIDSNKTAYVNVSENGNFSQISIKSDNIPEECTDIYLEFPDGKMYALCPQSGEYCAEGYFEDINADPDECNVIYYYNNQYYRAGLLEN